MALLWQSLMHPGNSLFLIRFLQEKLHLEISKNIDDTRHFVPKPKWHSVTLAILSNYQGTLDELLCNYTSPSLNQSPAKRILGGTIL